MTTQLMAQMDPGLWGFVSKFRDNSGSYNFVSQCMPYTGKFKIERKNLEEFWALYSDTLTRYDRDEGPRDRPVFISGISERPNEYLPLLVDIDLEIKYDPSYDFTRKLYTLEQVKTVATVYRRVMREVSREYRSRNMVCFILEKSAPYVSNDKIKGGFHLHFPRLWIRNCDHDLHIFPRVKKILNTEYGRLFESASPDKPAGDCVDGAICKAHWLMYGGCKNEKSGSYRVSTVLDSDGDECSIAEAMNGFPIYNAFDEPISIPDDKWEYYLPRILSTHPANRDVCAMKSNLEWASEIKLQTAQVRSVKHGSINVSEAMTLAADLMPMISASRSDGHDDWMEMGFCLYDLGDGSQEAFDLWVDFTKRSGRINRDEARCLYEWKHMTKRGNFTVGTLRYYASIDSPTEFEAWKKQQADSRIDGSLNGGHADLAQMLRDQYGDNFVCADPEKGIWYAFRDHRWRRIKKAVALRKKIKTDLVPQYTQKQKQIYTALSNAADSNDGNYNRNLQDQIKRVNAVVKNLNSAPFKDCIIRECIDLFHEENIDFMEILDADINLLGFNNGVFDVGTMSFRDGKPSDYISKTTGYDYMEFSDDHPRVQEVKDFFIKVFPDPLLRRFFLEYCAQLLKGGNFNKLFLNMVGSGDNAKSVMIEFLTKTLGQYAIKFPTTIITGKPTQSSQATPEVARSAGARFATVEEPDHKDVINTGTLKHLTGNDEMFARALYSDGRQFKPMFKLALVSNKLIHLSGNDQAIWNRILVLVFESCFPKDTKKTPVPETFEEQLKAKIFHRDPNFTERIPEMRQPFMWLLVQVLKEVMIRGPSEIPSKVYEATERYKQNNDVYLQWATENIRLVENDKGITLTEAYASFQQWFRDTFPRHDVPVKNDLRDDLLARWGPLNSGLRWPGLKIRSMRDMIDEGSVVKIKEHTAEEYAALRAKAEEVKEFKYPEPEPTIMKSVANYSKAKIPVDNSNQYSDEEDYEEEKSFENHPRVSRGKQPL